MKSAHMLSRLDIYPQGTSGEPTQLHEDDDVLSLNSWSDEINNHNHCRTHQSSIRRSKSLSVSSASSDLFRRDSVSSAEIRGVKDQRHSSGGENRRKSKRGSTSSNYNNNDESQTKSAAISTSNSTTSPSVKTKSLASGHRSIKGRCQDSDDLVHSSNQNSFPLSSDLKSASFDYPSLWENPLPPSPQSPDSENQQVYVVKGTRLKSHSSSPLTVNNAPNQKLYPNLDELRINDVDNRKVLRQTSTPSSKPSSSRPQFFDYSRSGQHRGIKQRDPNGLFPSSSVDPKIGLYPSLFTHADVKAIDQDASRMEYNRQAYFKSQPVISSQKSEFCLKQNNSSNDLESLNKQNLEHLLERENVKSKVMTVWNNIKYGWTFKPKSNIRLDSPLFLLGKVYHKRNDVENEEPEFLEDFTSRIWLTYRSNFYPIPGTKFTTDCGWGCMLRSGQMLMAQCFISHFLGRDWRSQRQQTETQLLYYKEIIRWFSDPIEAPSDKVPFCLHNLVNFGRVHNKIPGEWYGPGSVAYIFRDALTRASLSIPILKDVCIYVAQDCTVYLDDVNQLCRTRPKSESGGSESVDQHSNSSVDPQDPKTSASTSSCYNTPWCRSLIMLIPVRLGGESINEIYTPCIKSLLSYPHCMGIIGGKPKHSLYFIGWQDNKLIYLDPHYCREAIDTTHKNFNIESFHCTSPRKLSMSKMDPSCAVAFYIKDADEFKKFVRDVMEFVSPPRQRGLYPLFIFSNGSQKDADLANGQIGAEQGRVKVKHYVIDENGQKHRTMTRESEEFIML